MPRAKKTTKKVIKSKPVEKKVDQVEARPSGETKDPLAEGMRLYNDSNTEAETHYRADNSELEADEKGASKIKGLDANQRAEIHNTQSSPVIKIADGTPADQIEEVENSDREGR